MVQRVNMASSAGAMRVIEDVVENKEVASESAVEEAVAPNEVSNEHVPDVRTMNTPFPDVFSKTWATLAAEKCLTAKGMSRKFVSLSIKNGKSVAQIDMQEVAHLTEIWANAVVLYVVGQTPTLGAIIRFIALEWNNVRKPKVFLHEDCYFLVKFENMEYRNEILYAGLGQKWLKLGLLISTFMKKS